MARKRKTDPSHGRDRLIDAAIRVYGKNGVSETRLAEIAREADVDPPLVHYHFKSVEDLQYAVIERVLEHLKTASLAYEVKADPRERFLSYCLAPLAWVKKNPGLMSIWLYFYYLAAYHPRFRKLNDSIRKNGRERIQLLLLQIHEAEKGKERRFLGKMKSDALALRIQSWITGVAVQAATEEVTSDHEFKKTLEDQILEWLG